MCALSPRADEELLPEFANFGALQLIFEQFQTVDGEHKLIYQYKHVSVSGRKLLLLFVPECDDKRAQNGS
jgi:hypothetical protein